ncbi:hypothetical protein AVEN_188464-1 [Araneus ventricosus]|uniref:Uncharacterized protein n=1 Tax=Araneus ventricosus TaxID=182803 RepID=A0A4Y2GGK2_ARAVE|nr:hypothetical protein AVEN_188464-1 [Araneus ventricosus]
MEAPCKAHNRSLQSPRATVPTPPPAFETAPRPSFARELHSPSPFCGFRFYVRASLPFSRIVFQFFERMRQMENERHWISKLFDHNSQSSSHRRFTLTTGFGTRSSKWSGAVFS